MINHKFGLESSFQDILYLIDNWINKGSGWIVESIESEYITDHYREATELKSSKKGLITSKIKMKNVSR